MAKNSKNKENSNNTVIKVPISKFIDTKFREYALYVIESRGIPSFYDGLTDVQRFIIKNTPSKFVKTLSVVGSSIADNYHHGDASLSKAIGRLARPFGNSYRILDGYGFFGTEVSNQQAAPRYTHVKLSDNIRDMVKKYDHLNERDVEGAYKPFWLDYPIGLSLPIVGIAVGYKTLILPRKLEEVSKFIKGNKKADLVPYFEGFDGIVEKYNNSWKIQSNIHINNNVITVKSIPPLLKYSSAIKKLNNELSKYEQCCSIIDNSNKTVELYIKYRGADAEIFEDIKNIVHKVFSLLVTEIIVLIKDGKVLEYETIQEYLTDWKWHHKRLYYKHSEFLMKQCESEISYNKVKGEFIEYMLERKRTNVEIDKFYKQYTIEIYEKLNRLTPKNFTVDEIKNIEKEIKQAEKHIITLRERYEKYKHAFESLEDPTNNKAISYKRKALSLIDDSDYTEIDGVLVWSSDIADECDMDIEINE